MRIFQEKYSDGSTRVEPAVRFKNPTAHDVKFVGKNAIIRELHDCITSKPIGKQPDGGPKYARARTMDVLIKAGETGELPESVANLMQQYECISCSDGGPKVRWIFGQPNEPRKGTPVCIDPTHARQLIAGLAPQLVVVDDEDRVVAEANVHPNLVDQPAPRFDATDIHERTMRRLSGGSK